MQSLAPGRQEGGRRFGYGKAAAALAVALAGLTWRLSLSPAAPPVSALAGAKAAVGSVSQSGLPLPSSMTVPQYEERLFDFLNTRRYMQVGWSRDKGVRDTGPFQNGKYYGTHPAVRVFYSPGVMRWLHGGRVGKIADGEMIVKEQYPGPAVQHQGKTEEQLWAALESWTVMVKDSSGSHDGWFWSNPTKGQCVADNRRYPFEYPSSGFGLYCVRCHAATQSPGTTAASDGNEYVFASLRNIAGFPGDPLRFAVDDSWRKPAQPAAAAVTTSSGSHPKCTLPQASPPPKHERNEAFLRYFQSIHAATQSEVAALPPVTEDHVPFGRARSGFVTSDQCMSCHSGLTAPFGPSMLVPAGKNADYGAEAWDISPHGEWRWTPMGLAGRDPIFYAQVESEVARLKREFSADPAKAAELGDTLADTCLRCHGIMGKRQFDDDHSGRPGKLAIRDVTSSGDDRSHYGALARDGVSCVICHRMEPPQPPPGDKRPSLQYFLETAHTGQFRLSDKAEVYGPFKNEEIAPYVMEHGSGLKPVHSPFLKSARLCGSCHMVALPALEKPLEEATHDDKLAHSSAVPQFRRFHHHVEQATYLEWLNSEFENEVNPKNPLAKTCQDCHMSAGLKDSRNKTDLSELRTRIAAVQDTTYPEAENLPPRDQLNVRVRERGYRRHNFAGLNAFLLTLFDQFDDILGVRKTDFMTGSKDGIRNAIEQFTQTAQQDVADIAVSAESRAAHELVARVNVHNKVGHRFPSGVGFRRAFLELLVTETNKPDRVLWASGRTNELGVLIGMDGRPLATEIYGAKTSVTQGDNKRPAYQKHHEVITSPDQVQIYETLRCDTKGVLTTSFVYGCEVVKDNRLLPRGWKRNGPGGGLQGVLLEATYPDPETARDRRYADGSGTDEVTYRITLPAGVDPSRLQVRATLYYQAIPPYFLRNLFEAAPDGQATRRLYFLCSNAALKGTPIEGWKLPLTSATCGLKPLK